MQTGRRTLPRWQAQHFNTIKQHRPSGDVVSRLTHDDGRERALAGTVGTHHGMYFARRDGEVDTMKNFLVANRSVKIANFKSAHDADPLAETCTAPSTTRASNTATG